MLFVKFTFVLVTQHKHGGIWALGILTNDTCTYICKYNYIHLTSLLDIIYLLSDLLFLVFVGF